jgi:hypothetical protein
MIGMGSSIMFLISMERSAILRRRPKVVLLVV